MYGQGCLFLRVASRKKVISRERAREPLQSSLTAHILMVGFVEVAVVALVVRSPLSSIFFVDLLHAVSRDQESTSRHLPDQ